MPKKTSAATIKAQIQKLQSQLAKAEAAKKPAIQKVLALMKKTGVTLADLEAEKAPTGKTRGRATKSTAGRKVAVKYRDERGNAWSGRGRTPKWLAEAEAAGTTRDSFLVAA